MIINHWNCDLWTDSINWTDKRGLIFLIKDTIFRSHISPTTVLRVSKLKKRKHLICCSLFHTKVFVIFKGILDPFSIFHRSSIFLKQHTTNIVREVYYHKRQHIDMCRCVVVIIWCNNSTAYLCDTESWIYWNALFVKLLRKRDQN